MPVTVPMLALGVAAAGTGYSIYSGERANAAGKKANQAQRAQNDLQAARQKRDAIRAARLASAQATAAAESQGVQNSSSAQGGQGSIISQLGSNLSFLDATNRQSDIASAALGRQASWESSSRMGAAVSNLGALGVQYAPEIQSAFDKVFGKKGT